MPLPVAVTFALSAVEDLEELRRWYEELCMPETGERMLRQVLAGVERLASFPKSGRLVPEFGLRSLREIILPPFRIVYRVDEKRVRVVRVWRSERVLRVPEEESTG